MIPISNRVISILVCYRHGILYTNIHTVHYPAFCKSLLPLITALIQIQPCKTRIAPQRNTKPSHCKFCVIVQDPVCVMVCPNLFSLAVSLAYAQMYAPDFRS